MPKSEPRPVTVVKTDSRNIKQVDDELVGLTLAQVADKVGIAHKKRHHSGIHLLGSDDKLYVLRTAVVVEEAVGKDALHAVGHMLHDAEANLAAMIEDRRHTNTEVRMQAATVDRLRALRTRLEEEQRLAIERRADLTRDELEAREQDGQDDEDEDDLDDDLDDDEGDY